MTTISNKEIARAIYLSMKGKTGAEEEKANKEVVSFLSRKHLLGHSDSILTELGKIINHEAGRVEANVSSAKHLDEKTRREIKEILMKRYKAKEAVILEKTDERLIGGFRIEVGDEIIDLTLRNKIVKLQEHLTHTH